MTQQNGNTSDHALRLAQKIRRLAARSDLIAHKSRKDGNWYFNDFNGFLKSPPQGLDDQEALDFLGQV